MRKDEEVWEYQRSYERNVRTYLGDDVLTSAGSALVWWLAGPRTDEKRRVHDAVQQIANLRQLTQTATGADNATEFGRTTVFPGFDHEGFAFSEPSTSEALTQLPFLADPPSATNGQQHSEDEADLPLDHYVLGFLERLPNTPERALLARQLADHLRAQGFSGVADTISCRFDHPVSAPAEKLPQKEPGDVAENATTDDIHSDVPPDEEDEQADHARAASQNTSHDDDIDPGSAAAAFGS